MDHPLFIVESCIVTKACLNDKQADLHGGVVVMIRTQDNKLKKLVVTLAKRQVVSSSEQEFMFAPEPFVHD